MVPQTDLKVRMGIQTIALPSFTTGSQVFYEDVAGVSANYQFNENVGLTAFWARPFNDNFSGNNWGSGTDKYADRYQRSYKNGSSTNGFMDNVDLFALTLPLTFDGVKVTPWAMLGFIGPNAIKDQDYYSHALHRTVRGGIKSSGYKHFDAGMMPLGGAYAKDGSSRNRSLNSYGTAWWAGVTGDITVLDPLRIAFDANYGSVEWSNSRLNRAGWLASALVEYKLDWGVPGIVGWYASGDDDDPANGSERLPTPSVNEGSNKFSDFAWNGAPQHVRDGVLGAGGNMAGTWGVGLRLKDMSFLEDLKHTFRVNYIAGTNSPKMVKRYMSAKNDPWYGTPVYQYNNFTEQFGNGIGRDNLYMTTNDQALEFSLSNSYKMYENFTIYTQASYLATWLNNNRGFQYEGKRSDVKDPWNINVSFMYNF